jgi:hypothetical protein
VAKRSKLSLDGDPHLWPRRLNFDDTATRLTANAPNHSVARLLW